MDTNAPDLVVTAIAGNPKPDSRTLDAARRVASAITGRPAQHVTDVITLGPGLLGWGDSAVQAAVAAASKSDLVVVASPTFKATYTGVLKLFLDQFATDEGLAGVTAVPVMLGAGPAHAMAPELLLKPLLVELGATVPSRGLYLNDKDYDQPGALDGWLARWRQPILAQALSASARRAAHDTTERN